MRRVRATLHSLALALSIARTLVPFLLVTYLSFRIRRRILIRKLASIMKERGVPEDHAKVLAEGMIPDPLKLLREATN